MISLKFQALKGFPFERSVEKHQDDLPGKFGIARCLNSWKVEHVTNRSTVKNTVTPR